MSSGSLPKSLAHLVIREDPETGEIIEPTSVRRVSLDKNGSSPHGESSRLTRDSPYSSSPFPSRDRPSLPPLRLREDIYSHSQQTRRNHSPPRPQTSVSPPLSVHYQSTQRVHYSTHLGATHNQAYVPRSAPLLPRPFVEDATRQGHGVVHPQIPRRHSHQPYARPVTGYQSQPYPRPTTSTFESHHPSSDIGNPGGRGPISRTTKACDTCRTRKIRCEDGPLSTTGEPGPCMRCLAAGIECVFSGVQKKRGPCPGTTRPTTSTIRRSSSTSDQAMEESVSPQQRPRPVHIPVPSSARSSVGSIYTPHLLTPPEERRSSYGFSTSPGSASTPAAPRHSISVSTAVSAPMVPTPSAHWPSSRADSPETEIRSLAPRLPMPKSGRSLFDADYHLGLRLPSIDFARGTKGSNEDNMGPTSSTLKPILDESSPPSFWQRAT